MYANEINKVAMVIRTTLSLVRGFIHASFNASRNNNRIFINLGLWEYTMYKYMQLCILYMHSITTMYVHVATHTYMPPSLFRWNRDICINNKSVPVLEIKSIYNYIFTESTGCTKYILRINHDYYLEGMKGMNQSMVQMD